MQDQRNGQQTRRRLTERQRRIYEFVREKILDRGYGPTVREIGAEFGIRSPNGVMCHLRALERKGLITREPNMSRAIQLVERPRRGTQLPLAGQIAAGRPVLAEEQAERVDFTPMFDSETHYCLQVRGDSMIDDHIADGDYVVIRKQSTCRDGDIVVALVDGEETTLKRFYRDNGRYRLEPANKNMQPIVSDNVEVLGVVVGVVRRY